MVSTPAKRGRGAARETLCDTPYVLELNLLGLRDQVDLSLQTVDHPRADIIDGVHGVAVRHPIIHKTLLVWAYPGAFQLTNQAEKLGTILVHISISSRQKFLYLLRQTKID